MIQSVLKDGDQGSNCGAWCFAWWTFVGPSGAGGAAVSAQRAHGGGCVCESMSNCSDSDKALSNELKQKPLSAVHSLSQGLCLGTLCRLLLLPLCGVL